MSRPGRGGTPEAESRDREVPGAAGAAHPGGFGSGSRACAARLIPDGGLARLAVRAHSSGAAPLGAPRRTSNRSWQLSPAHEPEHRFSLLDRYVAGRELAAHVEQELAGGRGLVDVLADRFVSERLAERPYLLGDLLEDQMLLARVQNSDRTLDFDELERLVTAVGRADDDGAGG